MENEINNLKNTMGIIQNDLHYIKKSLDKNEEQHKELGDKIDNLSYTFQGKIQDKADHKEVISLLDKNYVTKENFNTVQKIVYGMAGAILLGFIYALFKNIF